MVLPPPESSRHAPAGLRAGVTALLIAAAVFFAAQFLLDLPLAAQAPPAPARTPAQSPSAPAPSHATAHRHKKPAAAKQVVEPIPAPTPAAPQIPNWPANNKPAEATVTWDSHGLFIHASNSSLDQILRDISLKTGAKIEGMGADERIFGNYGPGPARDVLNELLDGSGYNILLIGDLGQGTPRKVVLSGRPTTQASASGNPSPGATNDNNAENDQDTEQPDTNPPVQPPIPQPVISNAPGVPVRTPQQMLEQRQLQVQQMQQQEQQQQSNPQN
ncbi:MAG: hypothetical protein WAL45_03795 [Terracidiphilus sp.]